MESIKCIVIQNESNTNNFCVTDVIRKINNNTLKCEHIFVEIIFNDESFITGNLEFTPDENTIYIPKKLVHMFEGVYVVDIKLIDTKNIPVAKKIIIQQLSCELNSLKHAELIDKLFENKQLVVKGLAYNDGQINFLVKDILTSANKSVPRGISVEGVVIETYSEHKDVKEKKSTQSGIRGFKEIRDEDRAQSEKLTSQMEQLIQHFGQIAVQNQPKPDDMDIERTVSKQEPHMPHEMDVDIPKVEPKKEIQFSSAPIAPQTVKIASESPITDFSRIQNSTYPKVYVRLGEIVYIKA